ncbi:MAG: shikimate kinase [Candidatus Sulfobium sp.]|jgi:shikimate kinase
MKYTAKNIVLTGFMGTGKTEVGRELSRILDMDLIDIDTEIEAGQGMKITDIFGTLGEQRFREIESEMISKIGEMENVIISTGGGAVLREENMAVLREKGMIFCLSAAPATILKRTSGNSDRPLLNVEDPLARIRDLLEFRRPFYEKAGTLIDTEAKTPIRIAEEIAGIFRCRR